MKKLVLLAAAAALLTPALIASASAETSVGVSVGDNGHHYGWRNQAYRSRAEVVVDRRHCRTIVIRHKRWDGSVVIRKERRCRD